MKKQSSSAIIDKAKELGFLACGISEAGFLEQHARPLEQWLEKGYHGNMYYMENNFDKRLNPQLLVANAQSVISVLYNYYSPLQQNDDKAPVLSKYAYGKDYHFVVKDKLMLLFDFIKKSYGNVQGRCFVDSAPVLDKEWAEKSGLGWIGKNSCLINRNHGSFFFIGELIIDLPLDESQNNSTNHCGKCTKCINACPTQAIVASGVIDARKCISYLTIEYKEELPQSFKNKFKNRMFGCDICQDVCPWNKKATPHQEEQFIPNPKLLNLSHDQWKALLPEHFSELFQKSAVKRTKYIGLKRNIDFLLK